MRSTLLPLLVVAASAAPASADPMDEAMALVMAHHPEVRAREAEFRTVRAAPRWSANLRLSLTEGQTDYGSSGGPRAVVAVDIPLGGNEREREHARARRELATAKTGMRRSFLEDIRTLKTRAETVELRRERRDFWRDQLDYYREGVEAGIHEPEQLWRLAESLQQSEHDYRSVLVELEADLERAARNYGGDEWRKLLRLLVAIAS